MSVVAIIVAVVLGFLVLRFVAGMVKFGILAVIVLAAVALLLMTTGVFGEVGLVPVAAGLFVLMSAMGLAMPNTNAQALMRTKHAAGSASAT